MSTTPPGPFGGNLDVPAFGAGSTLYFPVATEGARFFVGDGHAAQGNGEVDSTALETSLTGEFEFALHEGPLHLECPVGDTETAYVVLGLGETVDDALERATERAISFLVRQKGHSAEAAYRLSSVAVDFAVSQAVNGIRGVHGTIPKTIFPDDESIDPRRFTEPIDWDR